MKLSEWLYGEMGGRDKKLCDDILILHKQLSNYAAKPSEYSPDKAEQLLFRFGSLLKQIPIDKPHEELQTDTLKEINDLIKTAHANIKDPRAVMMAINKIKIYEIMRYD